MAAGQAFNSPLARFKSETYIVLMSIAWTYLLHAFYRSQRVEYRYFQQGPVRKRFQRTDGGSFRYWDLAQCLRAPKCPLDGGTVNNLRFLIGLRNEIEHHLPPVLDMYLSGRYLACALNYEYWITTLFGSRHSLSEAIAIAIQFRDLRTAPPVESEAELPSDVARYIRQFDESLSPEERDDERFAFRLLFVRKSVGKIGQADRVIEFVAPGSSEAAAVPKERWALKEIERPKHRAKYVVAKVRDAGFAWFTMHLHTSLWKALKAREPARGYGVSVEGEWFWYDRWVAEVIAQCSRVREAGTDVSPKLWGEGHKPKVRALIGSK